MATVGIIVNPWAGKDVRRLHAPTGHTPDTAKVGIVRRIAIGALSAGADRVVACRDVGRIAERALAGLDGAELVDGPGTGSALDTRRGAGQLADLGCGAVAVLGGDGTCRDASIGWPDAVLVPISTGTNNVFPAFVDGSSAGTAAALVAGGRIDAAEVAARSKRLSVQITKTDGSTETDIALVDVGVIDDVRTGARAVVRADRIRLVVAAIASPASTGLSAIAGRVAPVDTTTEAATVVRLGPGGDRRRVQVPIVPGSFDLLEIAAVERIAPGDPVAVEGPGVLAYDGERERVLHAGDRATITLDRLGPAAIDTQRTLHLAAERRLFDVERSEAPTAPPEHCHAD